MQVDIYELMNHMCHTEDFLHMLQQTFQCREDKNSVLYKTFYSTSCALFDTSHIVSTLCWSALGCRRWRLFTTTAPTLLCWYSALPIPVSTSPLCSFPPSPLPSKALSQCADSATEHARSRLRNTPNAQVYDIAEHRTLEKAKYWVNELQQHGQCARITPSIRARRHKTQVA